jgi:hypothetical protein
MQKSLCQVRLVHAYAELQPEQFFVHHRLMVPSVTYSHQYCPESVFHLRGSIFLFCCYRYSFRTFLGIGYIAIARTPELNRSA